MPVLGLLAFFGGADPYSLGGTFIKSDMLFWVKPSYTDLEFH